ncbi:FAD-binding oxidoreductase [Pseudomaricurvus alkylphenolicus]|uniref:NAD(P)/FAD-dependent oxidoreductase n=1 Tax=Pseudomaricurvus alkylphenolicus TaxID=1306991 RepID=UPI0014242D27|nr:FAD-binding oxidoreductase [Pseudomaricurvus alkylphenolicus]NIB38050.1 FAD-binding oxidoreductase [Pseudomaricurvus alkylphenolicus]
MFEANKKWDVIIIGGGIVGVCAAYYAAKQGLKPLIIERDNIGAAQSGRCLGYVRRQGRDILELPMMIDAMDIWRNAEKELGRSFDWKPGGNLWCAHDGKSAEKQQRWLELAKPFNIGSRWLSGNEINDVMPGMKHRFLGALYTPDDGMADPVKATRAFYEAAVELGAETALGSVVDEIVTQGGAVQGVRIGAQLLKSDLVICAAGAASSGLLRRHGLLFPQDWVRASIMRTEPVSQTIAPGIVGGNIGLRQGRDGSLYVFHKLASYDVRLESPRYSWWFKDFLFDDSFDIKINPFSKITRKMSLAKTSPVNDIPSSWQAPYPDHKALAKAKRDLAALLPECQGIGIVAEWGGYLESTPDALPLIGQVEAVEGLLVASGYSGHGFGTGPIGGKRIIELATRGQADIPEALSPGRFRSGEWLDVEWSAI